MKWCVTDPQGARDAVLSRVSTSTIEHEGNDVTLCSDVRLSADKDSLRLADQFAARRREWYLVEKQQLAWLTFLRDEVFGDPSLAKIWRLQQGSEMLDAAVDRAFSDALEAAESTRAEGQRIGDLVVDILVDLMNNLARDERRRLFVLDLFDRLLASMGESELSKRLHSGYPELSSSDGRPPS